MYWVKYFQFVSQASICLIQTEAKRYCGKLPTYHMSGSKTRQGREGRRDGEKKGQDSRRVGRIVGKKPKGEGKNKA